MAAALLPLALGACDSAGPPAAERAFLGIETRLLDGDLVNFQVAMRGATSPQEAAEYAECAAAGYTLIRGYGFARHVRTLTGDRSGVQTADAIYTISPALPRGTITIDAEVVAAACRLNGIPTV